MQCSSGCSGALWKRVILDVLPENLQRMIDGIPQDVADGLEEIRIRQERPVVIHGRGKSYYLDADGKLLPSPERAYCPTRKDVQNILERISNYSIYAVEDELRNGYITLRGGYRVGLAGKAVLEGGKVKTLKYINCFNFRISREIVGVADKVMPYLVSGAEVYHTIVLSPPQMGKTTLIRDIARQLSNGFPGFRGTKVGIVDERSEIAGCFQGVPQNDVGMQTDILDACPKAEGIMMLIRSMSPAVVITDEIGKAEDVEAIEEALNAGVKIITTAHSRDIGDARCRPILSKILDKKIFQRIVVLGNSLGVGTVEKIYDGYTLDNLLERPIR
ncbi:stage III sporulation protein AA [Caldicoprobacter guelmensis]|uniref:stage III sporulation protein AA n=1 Tax=Caldicoprobacter guelmensis TaxID=1170224 RepID=UPI00195F0E30|nr:stage III sporulation protein AA [Caldicoprobacter guelmensis]MBM7581282.1 stage III sporulation protein AA [Caldicoprobacter guelmensis]